ncbi:hypothetical protein Tco_1043696 [Tanacetum coccineum]|uniref:Uncharacterized protein n=1 Tax=Tanacetum coccineum TaxID=301880 RepID=A0ABQ5GMV1_9ASTR
MWNDLILSHEGPSEIRDIDIATLRLKFNAFKALKGEKVKQSFTWLKILLNALENKDVKILQYKVNARTVTLDLVEDMSSQEFLTDLNQEYHDKSLLANEKRLYKRPERELVLLELPWTNEESLSVGDENNTSVKAFMAISEDEQFVGKSDARADIHYAEDQRKNLFNKFNSLKQELSSNQLLNEKIRGNVVHALGGRPIRKDKPSSKDIVFVKVRESPIGNAPDSESVYDNEEPLLPFPKLSGVEPT